MTTPHPSRSKRPTPAGDATARAARADVVPAEPAAPVGEDVVVHRWEVTGEVPPAAWAALLVDMRVVLGAAKQRGIVLAGPATTGAPVLDSERIALTVKFGPRPWSAPFVMSRATGPGEVRSPLGDAYDSLVLAALARAGRHLGALLTSSTEASPKATAMAGRLVDTLFGSADRAVAGTPDLPPRAQVEHIVAGILDATDAAADPALPLGVLEHLDRLLAGLQAHRDGFTEVTP